MTELLAEVIVMRDSWNRWHVMWPDVYNFEHLCNDSYGVGMSVRAEMKVRPCKLPYIVYNGSDRCIIRNEIA